MKKLLSFTLLFLSLSAAGLSQKDSASGKAASAAAPSTAAARSVVQSGDAPKPIGPYSQAIKAGEFVFCAGQIAIDPATGQLIPIARARIPS